MEKKIKSVKVTTIIAGKKIRCEVKGSWPAMDMKRQYVVIASLVDSNEDVLIPLICERDISVQRAINVTEEADKRAIEKRIDLNAFVIQYYSSEDMAFEIQLEYYTETEMAEQAERAQREAVLRSGLGLPLPGPINDVIRNIDTKIIVLAIEEYFANLAPDDNIPTKVITGLLLHLLKQGVLLTNFPFNVVEEEITSKEIDVSQEAAPLLRAFQNLILVFSRTEIIRQDVENTLVTLVVNYSDNEVVSTSKSRVRPTRL